MDQYFQRQPLQALPFQLVDFPGGVLLRRGVTKTILEGELALETILVILEATSGKAATPESICEKFARPDREMVLALIRDLCEKRFLVPAEEFGNWRAGESPNSNVFYWQAGHQPTQVMQRLNALHLTFAGINLLTSRMIRSLRESGVENVHVLDSPPLRNYHFFSPSGSLKDEYWDGPFPIAENEVETKCLVATTEFGGQGLLLEWNQYCVDHNIHFLPVLLQDMIGYVGPLVVPGVTPCLQCLRMRQNAHLHNVPLEKLLEEQATRGQPVAAFHPSMLGVLAETAVFELTHFFGELPHPRPGRLIRIDLARGKTQRNQILKVPRCPVCSPLNRTAAVAISKRKPFS